MTPENDGRLHSYLGQSFAYRHPGGKAGKVTSWLIKPMVLLSRRGL